MQKIHFSDKYLLDPAHPFTVDLIGVGGTGSQVLTNLARIDATLRALNKSGLHVRAWDDDIVTESNIGRQLFSPSDLGLNKAVCLISRINRFFGNGWSANPTKYTNTLGANITITCVDNIEARVGIGRSFDSVPGYDYVDHNTPLYWIDFGNTRTSGQVIMGSVSIKQPKSKKFTPVHKLHSATQLFDYSKMSDNDSGPSCSLAEAISKQDLFINSILAQLGCDLLWKLLRNGYTEHSGIYLNLETMKTNPITL